MKAAAWILPLGMALAVPSGMAAQQADGAVAPPPPPAATTDAPKTEKRVEVRVRRMGPDGKVTEDRRMGPGGPEMMADNGGAGEERMFMFTRQEDGPGGPMGGPQGMHRMGGSPMSHGMHGMHGDFWKNPMMVEHLKLTPDQVKRLDGIKTEGELTAIKLRAEVETQEVLARAAMEDATFDAKKADMAVDKLADARAALEKAEAKQHIAVRGVLTADQWKQMHTPMMGMEHHATWKMDGPKPPAEVKQ